jgi:hypothetical protein
MASSEGDAEGSTFWQSCSYQYRIRLNFAGAAVSADGSSLTAAQVIMAWRRLSYMGILYDSLPAPRHNTAA